MNGFRKVVAGTALAVSTFGTGIAIESNSVEASPIQQGIFDIPNDCQDYVGDSVSKSVEASLIQVGFTAIRADGVVTSEREQGAVLGAQHYMQEIGVLDQSIDICGYAGNATKAAVEKMLKPSDLAGESQVQRTQNNSRNSISNPTRSTVENNYTLEDCASVDDLSVDTIKAVQKALGVVQDGIFGNRTCNAMINFQESNGIAQYGKGFLGNRTARALGVTLSKKTEVSNGEFSPVEDCPRPSSCDIKVNLTTQRMSIVSASGVTLWEISVQSGKLGKETRTGSGKLGPVEYGPGRNPRRQSIDYPEATLVNPRGFGNGGQKIHGSDYFSANATNKPNSGSAGCVRVSNENSFVIAQLPSGTDVIITGVKPGTQQRYF
jgi:peptidoglycan hydrolase-like protein with peptidoglycan-binding domain